MVIYTLIGITILLYGLNFLLYLFLKKEKKPRTFIEKATLFFAVNISLLFLAGILIFFAKLLEDGILAF